MQNPFKFQVGEYATLLSGEIGEIRGRAEYLDAENSYFIRYVAGDGRLVESWWGESAIAESQPMKKAA